MRTAPLHDARDPEGLLSDIPRMGTTLLGLLAGYGCCGAQRAGESDGTGGGSGGMPGAGISVVGLVSAEQEDVDQLVCAGGGGVVAAGACAVLLGDRARDGAGKAGAKGWRGRGWSSGQMRSWRTWSANCWRAHSETDSLHREASATNPLAFADMQLFAHIPDPGWRAFAYSVSYTALCFMPVWLLYRQEDFLKV